LQIGRRSPECSRVNRHDYSFGHTELTTKIRKATQNALEWTLISWFFAFVVLRGYGVLLVVSLFETHHWLLLSDLLHGGADVIG
jgi:hypothetical protein